ncbi:DUF2442 domain-containing protein [Thermoflexus hugenholtzii]
MKALPGYRLWIRYSDGVAGTLDLSDVVGKGVFAAWENEQEFEKVHIGSGGEISWGEEIEMCPDALHLRITGKRPEDLFPRLREVVQQHA